VEHAGPLAWLGDDNIAGTTSFTWLHGNKGTSFYNLTAFYLRSGIIHVHVLL
jgi:hypothetical protein